LNPPYIGIYASLAPKTNKNKKQQQQHGKIQESIMKWITKQDGPPTEGHTNKNWIEADRKCVEHILKTKSATL